MEAAMRRLIGRPATATARVADPPDEDDIDEGGEPVPPVDPPTEPEPPGEKPESEPADPNAQQPEASGPWGRDWSHYARKG
jgi:hypothetical protein